MRQTSITWQVTCATLLLHIAGCGAPDPHARKIERPAPAQARMIETGASVYGPQATVTLRLTNTRGIPVLYNLCNSALERMDDGTWVRMRGSLAEVCTAELRTLPPQATAQFAFKLDSALPPGRYRVLTRLHGRGADAPVEAVSNVFRIRSKGSN